ncbi:MAG: helix-turn-helix domain-containing protein [Candidatus Delongbacteria bacterium]|nr:helix-turn-helix domain-containing protein [Candidatus Delongbacteria bacterium]MBN2833971.1 helix-turn-helix domain-containing protein [Candidatus Delongbacteria bacterium]
MNDEDLSDIQKFRLNAIISAKEIGYTETAKIFNVYRQTIAVWKKKYEKYGLDGLKNISRKKNKHPDTIPKEIEERIIDFKKAHIKASGREIKETLDIRYSIKTILKKLKDYNKEQKNLNKKIVKTKNIIKTYDSLDGKIVVFLIKNSQNNKHQYSLVLYDDLIKTFVTSLADTKDDLSLAVFIDYYFQILKYHFSSLKAVDRTIIFLNKFINLSLTVRESYLSLVINQYKINISDQIDNYLYFKKEFRKYLLFVNNSTSITELEYKHLYYNYSLIEQYSDISSRFIIPILDFKHDFKESTIRDEVLTFYRNENYHSESIYEKYRVMIISKMMKFSNYIYSIASELFKVYRLNESKKVFSLLHLIVLQNKLDRKMEINSTLQIEKISILQGKIINKDSILEHISENCRTENYIDLEQECLFELSNVYSQLGKYKNAITSIENAIYIADIRNDIDKKIEMILKKSILLLLQGEVDYAKKSNLDIYKNLAKKDNLFLKITSLYNLSLIYENSGKTDFAEILLNYSEKKSEENHFTELLAKIYTTYIPFYTQHTNYDKLTFYIIKLKEIVTTVKHNLNILMEVYNAIAFAYITMDQFEEAMIYLSKIIIEAENSDLYIKTCTALQNIGVQYFGRKMHKTGIKYFKKAIEISEMNNISRFSIVAHLNLAKSYYVNGKNSIAQYHAKRSLKLSKQLNLYRNIADCLVTISMSHVRSHEFDKAARVCNKLKLISNKFSFHLFESCSNYIDGIILTMNRNFKEAESFFIKAIEAISSINNLFYLSEALYYYGFYLFSCNRYDEAKNNIIKAKKMAENVGMFHIRRDCNILLIKLDKLLL